MKLIAVSVSNMIDKCVFFDAKKNCKYDANKDESNKKL